MWLVSSNISISVPILLLLFSICQFQYFGLRCYIYSPCFLFQVFVRPWHLDILVSSYFPGASATLFQQVCEQKQMVLNFWKCILGKGQRPGSSLMNLKIKAELSPQNLGGFQVVNCHSHRSFIWSVIHVSFLMVTQKQEKAVSLG